MISKYFTSEVRNGLVFGNVPEEEFLGAIGSPITPNQGYGRGVGVHLPVHGVGVAVGVAVGVIVLAVVARKGNRSRHASPVAVERLRIGRFSLLERI